MSWLFFLYLAQNNDVEIQADNLSNDQYIKGLQSADPAVLETVYREFRRPATRAVTAAGGSEAAAKVFFQTAIVEASVQAGLGNLNPETPVQDQVVQFALAHFADWLQEKGQPAPEPAELSASPETAIPDQEALRTTRGKIDGWKKGEITDDAPCRVWQKLRELEQTENDHRSSGSRNNTPRNIFFAFIALTLVYIVYIYLNRTMTPAEVYDDNFRPPESLMADLSTRYGPERGNDSVTARPNQCELLLRQADGYYKSGDFETAKSTLFEILEDSLTVCHSDALFYIGVIALQQEKPGLALECFSKIEDLEHFGDDIYWYQALAIVQLAETNPLLKEKAVRAVDRARTNARDSIRRGQADRMLKHLSE